MYAVVSPAKIILPPGSVLRMPGTWQDYCCLRNSRGDGSIPRIKFRRGEILLMSPLPRHGREANIVADVVKVLLDSEERNYEAFTPITMEIPEMGGIEPDYCFYIDNWTAAVGKDRIDWQTDPPPDLVIEIDVTTYTAAEDYLLYRVPEVWLFKSTGLSIYALDDQTYVPRSKSRYFPDINLVALMSAVLEEAATQGTGAALRRLRQRFAGQ
ncbi:Uma2 family endonuclease [Thermosynechococcus sp. HY213]|uniref:Uma2 family endonuclease n=1 Tax=Thermosynechococcus sp. HY213 TaxID=3074104 RepID=UPI00285B1098|nr:Uma2 family endonuclease [Thermosynechococcus sp. HY213]MDR7923057.1 Uma2 family endonuclease [Thermosynechococcus sp. HY213]